jgi:hypothetical protein
VSDTCFSVKLKLYSDIQLTAVGFGFLQDIDLVPKHKMCFADVLIGLIYANTRGLSA